ncbi:TrmH family RNA methyltransferase [Roseivirga sp. BDSF3-8]|uniref:TrmH family RNA methyltransferase n=1 Tax=Roseivirga sp. BDSF3-8 TaxID=3241598 RepID=UPI003531C1CC
MNQYDRQLLNYLSGYVTDNKKGLIERNLANRTRYVSLLLENIYKPHNASAILRTCDCLGIQDVHIVEEDDAYEVNPYVVRGASKWVDVYKYSTADGGSVQTVKGLKNRGYRILATSPHKEGYLPDEIPIDQPFVLALGNEHAGLSESILEMADGYVQIPQVGFTESYNISVAAAICLYGTMDRLWRSDTEWRLAEVEASVIRLDWYKKCVKNVNAHEKLFKKEYGKQQ